MEYLLTAFPTTVSVGGSWTSGQAKVHSLLASADSELYVAKNAGRDSWRVGLLEAPAREAVHTTGAGTNATRLATASI